MDNNTIMVSICCISYNHEPYIRQCIEGFVMQRTKFLYEILIHDDASTDNTQNIIKEYQEKYPDIIKPIYQKENQYSKGLNGSINATFNLPRANGKYIALCEGDDYWTDPLKLQKQYDFMEAHPEYGLVYTKAIVYNQASNKYTSTIGKPYNNDIADIILKNPIPTLTVMFRKDIFFKYSEEVKPQTKNWKMGDYPMWIYCSIKSKIKFIDLTTAVYRELSESASHSKNYKMMFDFKLSVLDIQLFYINKYKETFNKCSQITDDKLILNFYLNNFFDIAIYGNKELRKRYNIFLYNKKLYGLFLFFKILKLVKNSKLGYLICRLTIFCTKNNIIKSDI